MLVHPTHRDKDGTLLNGLSHYLNAPMQKLDREEGLNTQRPVQALANAQASANNEHSATFIRPGLIHRLDKQTSGLLVVAKTSQAHRVLSDHLKRKLVKKLYIALVDGLCAEDEGIITDSIGRFAEEKLWGVKADGKAAETRYRVLERRADSTLLELEPVTGRTNQLRIHCASIGHPIVGDVDRGGRQFSRLCLHARRLCFYHPVGGERLEFETPVPAEFSDINR
jgi:23S rRNA pseudouridine1911/1915/1917 synthase